MIGIEDAHGAGLGKAVVQICGHISEADLGGPRGAPPPIKFCEL